MIDVNAVKKSARDLWRVTGSFGGLEGAVFEREGGFTAENGPLSLSAETKRTPHGVLVRKDTVKNLSDTALSLSSLCSLFTLDGGEYEVYTQYNGWQNENVGGWQELLTEVSLRSKSIRSCHSAPPFVAIWSKQAKRGVAFHLLTAAAWEIRVARERYLSESSVIRVSLGLLDEGLALPLAEGESFSLPEILYYEFTDKTDMAAYKLHAYLNETAPRRTLPVVYNTWMYRFDHFTAEDVLRQIERAKDLGVEYFVIDAGWFGVGENWGECRGDWEENLTFGFRGRMKEVADAVRAAGMGFGFWLEAETAALGATSPVKHPDYYIKSENAYHLDFANPEAVDYIFDVTCGLIDRYGASYIKLDFNVDLFHDDRHTSFTAYQEGHDAYLRRLRKKYPALYLENCASGGTNMSVKTSLLYDSFWPSDDQSPYDQMRVIKNAALRMSPAHIDRFAVIRSAEALTPVYPKAELADKLIACCDATWDHVEGVHEDYLTAFLTGGAPCFSCDLLALDEAAFGHLQALVASFKQNRDFWRTALCHILTDTETVLTMEYRSPSFHRAKVILYTHKSMQWAAQVFPVLDPHATYTVSGKGIPSFTANGGLLMDEGVRLLLSRPYDAYAIDFVKKD